MLDKLAPRPGARHRPKRVGRGPGSGLHKTAGRGMKGQGKRSSGREVPAYFEGGQMPLVRRLPKRGFKNIHRKPVEIVNVGSLVAFAEGTTVDADALRKQGLIRGSGAPVKLLGQGEPPKNLTIRLARVSAAARKKIEESGGRLESAS